MNEPRRLCRLGQVLDESFDDIQESLDTGSAVTGLPTGYLQLDQMTSGLGRGDLVIVAGRPSTGKTALCNCIVDYVGVKEKKPVIYFSLEASRRDLVRNMISAHARVELQRIRRGDLANEDIQRLTEAADQMADAWVFIDDTPRQSVEEICETARRARRDHSIELAVIDYVQALEGTGNTRHEQVSHVARGLKVLARELNVPILATSHLSRRVDDRENRIPRLTDLSESGALECDADVVIFLYRECLHNPTPENRTDADLIVAKQCNGPTGRLPLHFFEHILRFETPAFDGTSLGP